MMRPAIDLGGQTFGRLKVSMNDFRTRGGKPEWLCRCECGKTIWARGQRLTEGRQISCGCAKADPDVRRAARLATLPEERTRIAKLGTKGRKAT